jgi:hypothetical protein
MAGVLCRLSDGSQYSLTQSVEVQCDQYLQELCIFDLYTRENLHTGTVGTVSILIRNSWDSVSILSYPHDALCILAEQDGYDCRISTIFGILGHKTRQIRSFQAHRSLSRK